MKIEQVRLLKATADDRGRVHRAGKVFEVAARQWEGRVDVCYPGTQEDGFTLEPGEFEFLRTAGANHNAPGITEK